MHCMTSIIFYSPLLRLLLDDTMQFKSNIQLFFVLVPSLELML